MTDDDDRQPPGAGRYGWQVAIVLVALCPHIVLTTAVDMFGTSIASTLSTSQTFVRTTEGLANAGYGFGAVLAAFLVQRLPLRRVFLVVQAGFAVSSVLAAAAPDAWVYAVGRIGQGTATGLMLIVALPPLTTAFGPERLPTTVAVIDVGLFGATTIGPIVGGAAATGAGWRWAFAATAVIGAAGVAIAYWALGRRPPFNRGQRSDVPAIAMSLVATVGAFFGVAQLTSHPFHSVIVLAPLVVGLLTVVVLLVVEHRRDDALIPIRPLSTSLPVTGLLTAMAAGAGFVSLYALRATSLTKVMHEKPLHAGLLFLPMPFGVAVATAAYYRLFRTRFVPLLVVAGFLAEAVAGIAWALSTGAAAQLIGAFFLGVGAGAAVSPGLFFAALAVPSRFISRAFALIELLRVEAAFMAAPLFLYFAQQDLRPPVSGVRTMEWVAVGVVVASLAAIAGIYRGTGTPMATPNFAPWFDTDDEPALPSPPTSERVAR
jgi:MFS family permease